ncbi:MAG: hypothetical protein MUE84_08825 [Hyphomonas sp.]|jgi:hypothetical protein|nr:hypothetical protein [Hyphomonas sp.]
MRGFLLAAASLALLSGCGMLGKSDKQALIDTCLESGSSEATCSCEATALEKNLPPELFKKVAQGIGREKQNQIEYLSTLPVEDLLAFSAVTNDLEACGDVAATGGQSN